MARIVNDEALDSLFRSGRAPQRWLARPVSEILLRALWELARLGPTGGRDSPARIAFVTSEEGRERLAPALAEDCRAAMMAAPVTVVFGCDRASDQAVPDIIDERSGAAALRDASLQAAYLILAARALGLECGALIPEFDHAAVDRACFSGGTVKSILLCALGYGDGDETAPRHPGLGFDEACAIV